MSWARHKPGTQWSGTSLDLTGVYIKSCGRDIHVILSLQHVGWNFNWFEFACHEAGTGCEDKCPPPLPSWQTLCCVVLLKNLLWGQNLSLQHVALNSAGLSLCVMKQGHDAEASPLIWLDFMKRFLVLGDKIFTPQHVAAWNSAGLNLCIMKRVHDDHIIGTVPATSPLASMSWLLSHCFKVWWVAFKLQI